MSDSLHIIDTSSIVNLKPFSRTVFESLWKDLELLIENEQLISNSLVLKELEKKDDDLHRWFSSVKNRKMFKPADENQLKTVKRILKDFDKLVDHDKESTVADPFVVALAYARKEIERTRKKPREVILVADEHYGTMGKHKIPDVCKSYNIRCIKLPNMLNELGFKY